MQHNHTTAGLLQQLADKDTRKVKLAIVDIDGILRGKVISFEKFKSVAEKGFGFCDVVFGWDANDVAYDNASYTGWHTGYPDATAVVDLQTFREIPWEKDLPFFIADFRMPKEMSLAGMPKEFIKENRRPGQPMLAISPTSRRNLNGSIL